MTIRFDPPHGGHPGEIVAHDGYLECPECGYAYPLDQGDVICESDACTATIALLVVKRAHPAPESTLRLI